jgi:hypothetical protein
VPPESFTGPVTAHEINTPVSEKDHGLTVAVKCEKRPLDAVPIPAVEVLLPAPWHFGHSQVKVVNPYAATETEIHVATNRRLPVKPGPCPHPKVKLLVQTDPSAFLATVNNDATLYGDPVDTYIPNTYKDAMKSTDLWEKPMEKK